MLTNKRGYSLISLMISLACGMTLMAGLASMVAGLRLSQQLMLDELMLQQELNRLVLLIRNELRTSGQTGGVTSTLLSDGIINSAFSSALSLSAFSGEDSQSCILFARDDNDNGVPDDTPVNEYKGLRLREKALEIRVAGRACLQAGWQDVSDTGFVSLERLQFSASSSLQSTLIQVSLTVSLAKNPQVYRHSHFIVRLQHG